MCDDGGFDGGFVPLDSGVLSQDSNNATDIQDMQQGAINHGGFYGGIWPFYPLGMSLGYGLLGYNNALAQNLFLMGQAKNLRSMTNRQENEWT